MGLLFAGNNSGSMAIANPIGDVLSYFSVTIDGKTLYNAVCGTTPEAAGLPWRRLIALTRFSFLFALAVGAVLTGSQILATADGGASGNERATAALIAGAVIVIVGVFLDAFDRRRDAFWFYVGGYFAIAASLVYYVVNGLGSGGGGGGTAGWS